MRSGCHDTGRCPGGLNNRSVSSHSSGGRKSQITVRRVGVRCGFSSSRGPHVGREPWSTFLLCQDPGPTGLGPILRTTFNLCVTSQAPSPNSATPGGWDPSI